MGLGGISLARHAFSGGLTATLLALAALMLTVPLNAELISYDGADYFANSGLNTRNDGIGLFIGPTPPDGLLAYEPFDYTADERLSQSNGGQGFTGAWSASLPGAVGSAFTIGTSSLASPGLSEDGAHTRTLGNYAQAEKRTLTLPLGEDGTVRYLRSTPSGTPSPVTPAPP